MITPTLTSPFSAPDLVGFWDWILNDSSLQDCPALEKLLAGCEVIAAVDDLELLAA